MIIVDIEFSTNILPIYSMHCDVDTSTNYSISGENLNFVLKCRSFYYCLLLTLANLLRLILQDPSILSRMFIKYVILLDRASSIDDLGIILDTDCLKSMVCKAFSVNKSISNHKLTYDKRVQFVSKIGRYRPVSTTLDVFDLTRPRIVFES